MGRGRCSRLQPAQRVMLERAVVLPAGHKDTLWHQVPVSQLISRGKMTILAMLELRLPSMGFGGKIASPA